MVIFNFDKEFLVSKGISNIEQVQDYIHKFYDRMKDEQIFDKFHQPTPTEDEKALEQTEDL